MTSPWGTDRPELPRRARPGPSPTEWAPPTSPRTPSKAERAEFVTHLMARLPASGEEPVSTRELADHFQLDQYLYSNLLWPTLARLADQGLVQRIVRDGERVRYWRRTPAGDRHVQHPGQTP
jgi:hypothetical protein